MAPGALALVMMTAPQPPERSAATGSIRISGATTPHGRARQSGGGAFAIGLRAGDDEAHDYFPCA